MAWCADEAGGVLSQPPPRIIRRRLHPRGDWSAGGEKKKKNLRGPYTLEQSCITRGPALTQAHRRTRPPRSSSPISLCLARRLALVQALGWNVRRRGRPAVQVVCDEGTLEGGRRGCCSTKNGTAKCRYDLVAGGKARCRWARASCMRRGIRRLRRGGPT